jgi:hypothetical protein
LEEAPVLASSGILSSNIDGRSEWAVVARLTDGPSSSMASSLMTSGTSFRRSSVPSIRNGGVKKELLDLVFSVATGDVIDKEHIEELFCVRARSKGLFLLDCGKAFVFLRSPLVIGWCCVMIQEKVMAQRQNWSVSMTEDRDVGMKNQYVKRMLGEEALLSKCTVPENIMYDSNAVMPTLHPRPISAGSGTVVSCRKGFYCQSTF